MRTFAGLRSAASQQVSKSAGRRVSESASQRVSGSAGRQVGESASRRVGKSAGQLGGAQCAGFHLLLLWTFVRIRLQLPGKNRTNGMRCLQTFLQAGS